MRRNIGLWRAAANAGFALAVMALAGFGLYQVAGRHWRVQPMFRVRAEFATIGGLEAGHRVRLQGIDAGVVERVIAPPSRAGRSSWSCGLTSGSGRWSATTRSRGSFPRDSWVQRLWS